MILGIIIAVLITISEVINRFRQKECPHCRELTNKNATVCPRCQKDLSSSRASQQPQGDSSIQSSTPTRKCPFCGEFIKKEAVVCRFCGRNVPSETEEFLDACKKGWEDKVKDLLEAGVDVNARDKDGVTPLMISTELGFIGIVERLLANGAGINMQDERGYTPLMRAVMSCNFGVVDLLLKNGAGPNIENWDANTALQLVPAEELRIAELINEVIEKAAYEERRRLRHDKAINIGLVLLAVFFAVCVLIFRSRY